MKVYMKLRPELALREKKTRLDATSAQCSQSAAVYLLQKAAGGHFSLPGACVFACAFVCGLKSTGNVCVFKVFAPVSLYLSLSLQLQIRHTMAGCSSSTLQHGRAVAARLSPAEQRHSTDGRRRRRCMCDLRM